MVTSTHGVPSAAAASSSAPRIIALVRVTRYQLAACKLLPALTMRTSPHEGLTYARQDFQAFEHPPEHHMLAVALRRGRQRQEELAGVAVCQQISIVSLTLSIINQTITQQLTVK